MRLPRQLTLQHAAGQLLDRLQGGALRADHQTQVTAGHGQLHRALLGGGGRHLPVEPERVQEVHEEAPHHLALLGQLGLAHRDDLLVVVISGAAPGAGSLAATAAAPLALPAAAPTTVAAGRGLGGRGARVTGGLGRTGGLLGPIAGRSVAPSAPSRRGRSPGLPDRPPLRPRRSRRSTFGRGWVGRTRARTRASPRVRPNSPVLGSSTTSNSASCSSTPSWSSAASLASSIVLPVVSTHSMRAYLRFFFFLDRFWVPVVREVGATGLAPLPLPLAVVVRGSVVLAGFGVSAAVVSMAREPAAEAGESVALARLGLELLGLGGRLLGLGAEGVLAVVEGPGDVGLHADAVQVRRHEVHDQGRRATRRRRPRTSPASAA